MVLTAVAVLAAGCVTLCAGCRSVLRPDPLSKITFDMTVLRDDGLRGPPDGLRSLSYEFCIPNTDECKAEVAAIDSSVQFMPGSRGRIGCGEGQCLCIGDTHQPNHRQVLKRLAELEYVDRIDECFFE